METPAIDAGNANNKEIMTNRNLDMIAQQMHSSVIIISLSNRQ